MRLSDFFEDYYKDEKAHIIRIKGLDRYFLKGKKGQFRRKDAMYLLTKDQVNEIMNGQLSVQGIKQDYIHWMTIEFVEKYFTEKHLKEIAEVAAKEDRAKAAKEEANKKRDEGEER